MTPLRIPARALDRAFLGRLLASAKATLRLALPAMGSRAGILLMLMVDTVMVGHTGQEQLAFLGAAFPIQSMLMLIGIGLLQGTMVLTSQAFGAREYPFCGEVWRVALIIAGGMGAISLTLSLFGEPFLLAVGFAPYLAEGGGRVIAQFGWGLPAMMIYIACSYFLEGIQRPRIAMMVMGFAVLLNIALNAVVLYGWNWGAEGAAATTSITRFAIATLMALYITRIMADRRDFGIRLPGPPTRESVLMVWRYVKRALRLGAPMGATQGAETIAFTGMTLAAGVLGEAALAAHTITMQLVALIFMLAIGMSSATAVRVGFAVGSGDPGGLKWAAWTGMALITLIMLPLVVVLLLFPLAAAMIFTTAPATLAIAAITVRLSAGLLLVDSFMVIMQGALRGAGDVMVPMLLHMTAMWGVLLPLGLFLALPSGLGWGAPGLITGIVGGMAVAAIFAISRFVVVSGRKIDRA